MAGNANLRRNVHRHLGDRLRHTVIAGATHQEPQALVPQLPTGEPATDSREVPFFIPDQIAARTRDWCQRGIDARIADAWRPFLQWCDTWLVIKRQNGPHAVEATYREILDGKASPHSGHVLSIWPG